MNLCLIKFNRETCSHIENIFFDRQLSLDEFNFRLLSHHVKTSKYVWERTLCIIVFITIFQNELSREIKTIASEPDEHYAIEAESFESLSMVQDIVKVRRI